MKPFYPSCLWFYQDLIVTESAKLTRALETKHGADSPGWHHSFMWASERKKGDKIMGSSHRE